MVNASADRYRCFACNTERSDGVVVIVRCRRYGRFDHHRRFARYDVDDASANGFGRFGYIDEPSYRVVVYVRAGSHPRHRRQRSYRDVVYLRADRYRARPDFAELGYGVVVNPRAKCFRTECPNSFPRIIDVVGASSHSKWFGYRLRTFPYCGMEFAYCASSRECASRTRKSLGSLVVIDANGHRWSPNVSEPSQRFLVDPSPRRFGFRPGHLVGRNVDDASADCHGDVSDIDGARGFDVEWVWSGSSRKFRGSSGPTPRSMVESRRYRNSRGTDPRPSSDYPRSGPIGYPVRPAGSRLGYA